MRLGVVGVIPADLMAFGDQEAQAVRALGFSGVAAHISGNPLDATRESLIHLRDVLQANGLRLVQFWGWYPSIVTADKAVRDEGLRAVHKIFEWGAFMGADMVGLRPTSTSPNGPWSPDRGNYQAETRARLVASLRQITPLCEGYGMPAALECHVTTTLDTPQNVRAVLDDVGSPWLKVNLDPVNFVRDLPTAYDTTGLLHDLFDRLGPSIAAAHVKDVLVEDDHVVHIRETPPGNGLMDYATFFRGFEAIQPDGYALIEHLKWEQIPAAAAFVRRTLDALNITIRE